MADHAALRQIAELLAVVVMVLDEPVDVLPDRQLFPLEQHTGTAAPLLLGERTPASSPSVPATPE